MAAAGTALYMDYRGGEKSQGKSTPRETIGELASVDFKVGDLVSRAAEGPAKGIDIKVNDAIVKAEGADVQLTSGEGSAASLTVSKGKVTLVGPGRQPTQLTSAEKASLDAK